MNNSSNFPNQPGVYLFKDKLDQILYVGKAVSLRKRVNYYLRNNRLKNREINLPRKSLKISCIVTNSELESFLLEARLIKQYQPKYNVKLKDDKRYLCVGITKGDYPRVVLVRQPEKEANLKIWFGPFPSARGIAEILRLLRRIFPYCADSKCRPGKPCFAYHLHLCPGVGLVSRKDYQQNIQKIELFLNGEIAGLVKKLTGQMKQEAANLRFEKALLVKKQIEMIENLLGKDQKNEFEVLLNQRIEAYDIANLGRNVVAGSMVVLVGGKPERSAYRQFKVAARTGGDTAGIKEVLLRRLKHREWVYPQLILIDGGKAQTTCAFEALKKFKLVNKVALLGFAKRSQTILVPIVAQNEITGWKSLRYLAARPSFRLLRHAQDEAHRFAQRYYKKVHQKTIFPASGLKRRLRGRN